MHWTRKLMMVRKPSTYAFFRSVLGVLLFLCAAGKPAVGQSLESPVDSSVVSVRQPPASVFSTYRENPDYQYTVRTDQALTFWQRIRQQFFDWLSRLFDENKQGTVWKYVFYVVAGGLVFYAILRLFRMDLQSFFSPRRRPVYRGEGVMDTLEPDTDFIALAAEARSNGKLRLAARMYYMHVLHVLDAGEVIRWTPRKTNQDYVHECATSPVDAPFRRLTYLFDYAWYGDFPVDDGVVTEIQALAQQITDHVRVPA